MSVLALWKSSPALVEGKTAKQILAISGNGKLAEDGATSSEFRALLAELPSAILAKYALDCLEESFADSGLVLQDVVNEMGVRLGMKVAPGRYRGRPGLIGKVMVLATTSLWAVRLIAERPTGLEGAADVNLCGAL